MAGQSLTELKNIVLSEITNNTNIIKALVMHSEDFLTAIPTEEEQYKIDNAPKLIRKQIFPYKNITLVDVEAQPYITSGFYNFEKIDRNFIGGIVRFYIIIPIALEETDYGSRYDVITDMLEDLFNNTGIGVFEFKGKTDVDLPVADFQCHSVWFNITDFHWKDN
jgi:hypothetical protein